MEENNKRIAKNTLMLYMRTILMMGIGLYTSRVILRSLGVTDFGIYNAVGGVVAMFGFISTSLGNATSRFITIAIGRGDQTFTNQTFGNIKVIYYTLCVIIVLLAETVGLWFLYNKMTIPAERMDAAFWVFQFSILSAVLGLISVPYISTIIAHEKMSAFAYTSLLDSFLKLLICFLLQIIPYDRLGTYAFLFFIVEVIDRIIYAVYCNRHFEEVHSKARLDRTKLKEVLSMSVYTLMGNLFWILNTQGVNLLLNIFFGPIVNAARGIATQAQGAMSQFVANFQTAINPQITKSYADGNSTRMHHLLQLNSKFSFLLMFVMSVPVFIEAPVILKWWLKIVPDNTVIYFRIILLYSLLGTLTNPLWVSVLATGKLKKYQLIDSLVQASILPIAYIVFKYLHAPSYWIFLILVFFKLIEYIARIIVVLPLINHRYLDYTREVIKPLLLVFFTAPLLPLMLATIGVENEILNFLLLLIISIASCMISIWLLGLNKNEKIFLLEALKTKILKFNQL